MLAQPGLAITGVRRRPRQQGRCQRRGSDPQRGDRLHRLATTTDASGRSSRRRRSPTAHIPWRFSSRALRLSGAPACEATGGDTGECPDSAERRQHQRDRDRVGGAAGGGGGGAVAGVADRRARRSRSSATSTSRTTRRRSPTTARCCRWRPARSASARTVLVSATRRRSSAGSRDGQYSMTYDGIPFNDTNDPTHHSWAFFPAQTIGSTVFDRSPGSAATIGPSTYGGSVSLLSRSLNSDRLLNGTVSYGSFNTRLFDVDFNTGRYRHGRRSSLDVRRARDAVGRLPDVQLPAARRLLGEIPVPRRATTRR